MIRRLSVWTLAVLAAGVATSVVRAQDASPGAAAPVTLTVAGRSSSTPWIAAHGSRVAVAWAAADHGQSDIFVAMSSDAGATFAAPVQVNTVVGEARVNGEIPPRVALHVKPGAPTPDVVVAWNAKDQGTEIKIARSVDGGRTFAAPVSLQATGAAGDRGWHSLALDQDGVAHVIWLDHRGLAEPKDTQAAMMGGEHDGVAMAQKSRLYYASFGVRASPERALTPGVCYCCKSAVVALPGGRLVAAWRHVYADNMRDMAFTVSRDGGRTFAAPAPVSQDGWSINGCPDDGPALAAGPDRAVHIVWPTVIPGAEPMGALFYSVLRDEPSFAPRTRIPTLGAPKPSYPQIVVDGAGRMVAAWDESVDGVRTAA
ncbi:MAG TPA: sialidase family protein, partial [Vicinamibacterales bacterium]|nr:sialidase family protein [Vicinamibacterales bacterium]